MHVSHIFVQLLGCALRADADRPNFIFIFGDDWGWGDVGFNDPSVSHTPNLDKMAGNGVIFSDFHSPSSVCSPSRAGFMTGRDPARFRIHTALNSDWTKNAGKDQANFLESSEFTVTRLLKDAGYVTGHFGKWHLGSGRDGSVSAPLPAAYGIDVSCTFNSNDVCQADGGSGNTSVDIVERAMGFINDAKAADQPFYANIWLHVSHNKLDPTAEQKAAATTHCRAGGLAENQTECAELIFVAAQQDADAQIGRLDSLLGQLNLRESTLVFFSTDNGPEERLAYFNAQGTTGPFRGRKRSLYEGGIRVPSFAVWGGNRHRSIPAGGVEHTPLSGTDWLPTVAAIAGVALPEGFAESLDGEDMSSVFLKGATGQRTPESRTKRLFWEWIYPISGPCDNVSPHLAVRDGDWKFLANADGSRPELYKLDLYRASAAYMPDFHERHNLVDVFPDKANQLAKSLQAWRESLPGSSSRQYTSRSSCEQFTSGVFPGSRAAVAEAHEEPEDSEPDSWFDPNSGEHVSYV